MDFLPNKTMIFVYELPSRLSNGFCFGGGQPIVFKNIDWFNGFNGVTREHIENELRRKQYMRAGNSYLVLSPDNDLSFTFKFETEGE